MAGCRVTAAGKQTGRWEFGSVVQYGNQYSLQTNGSGRVCWTGPEALPFPLRKVGWPSSPHIIFSL